MSGHVLAVRQDSLGDVLLTGPAIRAIAARAERVTMLVGPRGSAGAALLHGVTDTMTWRAPWIDPQRPSVSRPDVEAIVDRMATQRIDEAVVFTSFHQSPLPTALLLRLAGVPRISAFSVDYPGSLLDVRCQPPGDVPEPERALSLADAAGFPKPDADDGRLAVRDPLPDTLTLTGPPGYLVVHPGASAPARTASAARWASIVATLAGCGHRIVVTGLPHECDLTASVSGGYARDLGGRTSVAQLASVLAGATAVVAPNTGIAHLAAAVGTPVVSLHAPVVPASRWAPYGVPSVLLGDQSARCAGTRASTCPVPGHPCLEGVTGDEVVAALEKLSEVAE